MTETLIKDLELVEYLGLGLNRILSVYGKESFEIHDNFMRNVFYKNKTTLNVGVNEIYAIIKENEPIKATVIAKNFSNVTQRTIERYIKQLKDDGKIEFIGSPKTGGYRVVWK